ncbi:hypothetical protein IT399_02700 [Candidatus Nomurabacteria bacterium]|nr:hypothetical protein [Candidatus Nomurabacteria bacterium]
MEFSLNSGRKGKVVVVFEGEGDEISSHQDELKYLDSDIRQSVDEFAKDFLNYLFGKAKMSYPCDCGGVFKYHTNDVGTAYWECGQCERFTDKF